MSGRRKAIDEFWLWFQAHRTDFDTLVDPETPFWDVALSELKRVDRRLWFELSRPDGGVREFIITTEGQPDSFPMADEIVSRAPSIDGWQFIALKQAKGFDFKMTYEGISFDPRTMWFLPLQSDSRPRNLGLRIGVPDFSSAIKRQAQNAILVILDSALGERSAVLDIQHVEVSALPEFPESEGYIELPELPAYIEWRKRKHKQA